MLFHGPDGLLTAKKTHFRSHDKRTHHTSEQDENRLFRNHPQIRDLILGENMDMQDTMDQTEEISSDRRGKQMGTSDAGNNVEFEEANGRMGHVDEPFLLETLVESLKCELI